MQRLLAQLEKKAAKDRREDVFSIRKKTISAFGEIFSLDIFIKRVKTILQQTSKPTPFTFTALQQTVRKVVTCQLTAAAKRNGTQVLEETIIAISQYITAIHRNHFDFNHGFWQSATQRNAAKDPKGTITQGVGTSLPFKKN
jgi:hypothetical protein